MVASCLAIFAGKPIAEGKTFSSLGDYKIEMAADPVLIDGKELEAFVISYANTDYKVTVAVNELKNCTKYYVLSDNLSVQYVSTDRYFGVERLGKEAQKAGFSTDVNSLNLQEYFHQKLISDGRNDKLGNSMLIAAYFPFLLKEQEALIAER
jgi:hypothetical protein